jgi:hypothetical protein
MLLKISNNQERYVPREARKNYYYKCVEDNFEILKNVWDDKYQKTHGFWRPHILDVIFDYLNCGDLHLGFARVKCEDCNKEYLLPFSCKRRSFCPSCHQRRVIEFGEFLCTEVLKAVPHRHWVFGIPKRLRIYFLYDRTLLSKLSRCAWNVLSTYLKTSSGDKNSVPGVVIAVQTFGDLLNFNPHLHLIASDGCFKNDQDFIKSISPKGKDLEKAFQMEVLNMLEKEGKITQFIIDNMLNWENTGFNVYCSAPIYHEDNQNIEKLSQYIIHAPISQERMFYIPSDKSNNNTNKIIYKGKNNGTIQTFNALDWLAQLVTHLPNKGEQSVRYYGHYSNKCRGQRKKANIDNKIPTILNNDVSKIAFRKSWARLIQKVYNVDPLKCTYCNGKMRVISIIEDEENIKKILQHLNLWEIQNHDPPNNYKIPPEYKYLPEKNIVSFGSEEKTNTNKFGSSPDYDNCDPIPNYEEWF